MNARKIIVPIVAAVTLTLSACGTTDHHLSIGKEIAQGGTGSAGSTFTISPEIAAGGTGSAGVPASDGGFGDDALTPAENVAVQFISTAQSPALENNLRTDTTAARMHLLSQFLTDRGQQYLSDPKNAAILDALVLDDNRLDGTEHVTDYKGATVTAVGSNTDTDTGQLVLTYTTTDTVHTNKRTITHTITTEVEMSNPAPGVWLVDLAYAAPEGK